MNDFICKVINAIINPVILLISAGAFIYFLYGLMRFIQSASVGGNTEEGKNHMIWGIVGLAIIFGAYGIINVVIGSFGIPAIGPLQCPG